MSNIECVLVGLNIRPIRQPQRSRVRATSGRRSSAIALLIGTSKGGRARDLGRPRLQSNFSETAVSLGALARPIVSAPEIRIVRGTALERRTP